MDNKFFIQCFEDYIRKDYEGFIEFMKEKGFSSIDVDSFDFDNLIEDDVEEILVDDVEKLESEIEKLESEIEDLEGIINDKDFEIENLQDELEELRVDMDSNYAYIGKS